MAGTKPYSKLTFLYHSFLCTRSDTNKKRGDNTNGGYKLSHFHAYKMVGIIKNVKSSYFLVTGEQFSSVYRGPR